MLVSQVAEQQVRSDRLSRRNFNRMASYINRISGIKMPPSKMTMLEGRLRRRLRATGYATLDDYCDFLFDEDGMHSEAVHLIDAVTTNKTDFFREPAHFDYLRDTILPSMAATGRRSIRIWSAACSTGAEPYTIAMLLEEFAEEHTFAYKILATDLSTEVLATAHRGVYSPETVAPVPNEFSRKYVMQSTRPGAREVRIHPKLRSKVGFARMNLMDEKYRVGDPMDLIFCRNVLIYFDKSMQAAVLSRLCDCLIPGGYLFIGHSESLTGFDLPVTQVANTIFQKT